MSDSWDRLRERLPEEAGAALEAELIRREDGRETCRVALVVNVLNGSVTSCQVSGLRGVRAVVFSE